MSTHNIGFYEDLTKIIFELSSNIIKYAPYFFCWLFLLLTQDDMTLMQSHAFFLKSKIREMSHKTMSDKTKFWLRYEKTCFLHM